MAGALAGLRVVEIGRGLPVALAGMMLADNGAEVVRVERPEAPAPETRFAGHLVWSRGKARLRLDLATPEGRVRLDQLAQSADVLLVATSPATAVRLGLGYEAFRAANPALIYTAISPYGSWTAEAGRPGWDVLVQARTGLMDEQPGHRPGPIFHQAPLPSYGATFLALLGTLAALHVRHTTGRGQRVETSLKAGALMHLTMHWARAETPTPSFAIGLPKNNPFGRGPVIGVYRCGDSKYLHYMGSAGKGNFARMVTLFGFDPDRFGTTSSPERAPLVEAALEAVFLTDSRDNWVRRLWAANLPTGPSLAPGEVFDDPQVAALEMVVERTHPTLGNVRQIGLPLKFSATPGEIREPTWAEAATEFDWSDGMAATRVYGAPEPPPGDHAIVQEHVRLDLVTPEEAKRHPLQNIITRALGEAAPDEPAGDETIVTMRAVAVPGADGGSRPAHPPLAGIRLLDFGLALAGPFGPMLLGDLGADVIKIEPVDGEMMRGTERVFAGCQRNKRGLAVDLKAPEGLALVQRLVATADIVHHNMRPGVAERLGIGYAQLREIKPDLIYCHAPAYGSAGPYAHMGGFDQVYQAFCGHEVAAGGRGNPPNWNRTGFVDYANAILSVIGVLMALRHRDRTGEGQYVESAQLSAGMLMKSEVHFVDGALRGDLELDGAQSGFGPFYRIYPTAQGWLALACPDAASRGALARALDLDPAILETADAAEAIAARLAARPAAAWQEMLHRAGVAAEVVREGMEARFPDDPQNLAEGWATDYPVRHAVWGALRQVGALIRFGATPMVMARPCPTIGQHTREILAELGVPPEEQARLRHEGVVAWADAENAAGGAPSP
jgi:crotonobetainyl-CoA:carnitine CoA-transferase CaiB-like acyl-CoA transferase